MLVGYGSEGGQDYWLIKNRSGKTTLVTIMATDRTHTHTHTHPLSSNSQQKLLNVCVCVSSFLLQLGVQLGGRRLHAPHSRRQEHVRHRQLRPVPNRVIQTLLLLLGLSGAARLGPPSRRARSHRDHRLCYFSQGRRGHRPRHLSYILFYFIFLISMSFCCENAANICRH